MAAKTEIAEVIREIKENLTILRKAKKACTCYDSKPHYHELLWDAGTGNEYFAESKREHEAFIKELTLRLQKLQ